MMLETPLPRSEPACPFASPSPSPRPSASPLPPALAATVAESSASYDLFLFDLPPGVTLEASEPVEVLETDLDGAVTEESFAGAGIGIGGENAESGSADADVAIDTDAEGEPAFGEGYALFSVVLMLENTTGAALTVSDELSYDLSASVRLDDLLLDDASAGSRLEVLVDGEMAFLEEVRRDADAPGGIAVDDEAPLDIPLLARGAAEVTISAEAFATAVDASPIPVPAAPTAARGGRWAGS